MVNIDEDESFGLDDPDNLAGTIVPNKLLVSFGKIAVYYSNLDWQLSVTIWWLLGLKEHRGEIVTQAVGSFASRVEMFRVLASQKYKSEKRRKRISEFAQQLRFAGDDRNRLMHDVIFASEGANDADRAAIKTLRSHPITRTTNEHYFDRATMRDLQTRLYDLWFMLYSLPPGYFDWREPLPSLDKSPTQLQRRKNEALQRKRDKLKPRRQPSRPKSRRRKG